MKRIMTAVLVVLLGIYFVSSGCKSSTPSDPETPANTATVTLTRTVSPTASVTPSITPTATLTSTPDYAAISGTISLPNGVNRQGKTYQVLIDTDMDFTNGITAMVYGVYGSSESMPYSVTVPAGSYYAYSLVKVFSANNQPPVDGDYLGIHGAAYPSLPSSPTLNCSAGQVYAGTNIAMTEAVNNVSGTITMPGDVSGVEMILFIDNDQDPGNGGVMYYKIENVTTSSSTYAYAAVCVFPGDYYINVMVDNSGGGLPAAPASGDYVGVNGPFTMTSDNASGPASNEIGRAHV